MNLGLDFFKNKFKNTYKLHQNHPEIKEKLKETIKKYIKVESIPLKHRIINSINFCLEISEFQIIYLDLFEFFLTEDACTATPIFVKTLESLIRQKRILTIPSVIFGKMVQHYSSINEISMIEVIILNLDPLLIKPSLYLSICEEYGLITGFIFISTNSALQDYKSPLKKIFKLMIAEKDETKQLHHLYKILWFVRMTLKGKKFPDNEILEKDKENVFTDVIKWVFKRNHLIYLLKLDSTTTLNAIKTVFEEKYVINIINNLNSSKEMELINVLFSVSEEGSLLYHQICLFSLAIVSLRAFLVSKDTIIKISAELLSPKSFITGMKIFGSNINEYISNFLLSNSSKTLFENFSLEEIDFLIAFNVRKYELQASDISEIYKIAQFSPFSEVLLALQEINKEYKKCLDFFINSLNFSTKIRVFE